MNFPKYRTFQLIIPMLKEFNIRHIVISPGSRMREFVLAVEEDPFFTTYDVTDERSASYFALGLSQQLNEPVVITCTSSTATTNYVPGVTEAFFQNVPIIVLTGDRDPYMLGCQEDQMINQVGMYDRIVRKSVTLPIVRTQADEWYCERLLNEALLELNHHKMGPVHINVPVPAVIFWNDDKPIIEYPKVKRIRRYEISEKYQVELSKKVKELASAKKILVLAGQNVRNFDVKLLEVFFSKYNCTVHAEHMGNIESSCKLNLAACSEVIPEDKFDEFVPDILISFHGTIAITRNLKEGLRTKKCQHWLIDEAGDVIDAYKNLTDIFECTPEEFFSFFNNNAPKGINNNKEYYNKWLTASKGNIDFTIPFSNVYAVGNFIKKMPDNSNLHLSILNSIRISQYYQLPKGTKVYANVGTDGIDGCLSSFFGQAASSSCENFIIVGDLSFFYDMSSLRIKHNKANCHILLINNHGGNEFYQQPIMPTTPQGLGASHHNNAKAWAESVGFNYLSASSSEEFDKNVSKFVNSNNKQPVLFEIFTDQIIDRETVFALRGSYRRQYDDNAALKDAVKSIVGDNTIKGIKRFFRK